MENSENISDLRKKSIYYFNLSKQAKEEKAYEEEKCLLIKAYELDKTNKKILNALVRVLRRLNDNNLKYYLNELYNLAPNGKILEELLKISQKENDHGRIRELLLMRKEIEPDNKKNNKLIKKYKIIRSRYYISPSDYELITIARNIIYSDLLFEQKINGVNSLLAEIPEELLISVLAELYLENNQKALAIQLLKDLKRLLNENDRDTINFINKLYAILIKKRYFKGELDYFWSNNNPSKK